MESSVRLKLISVSDVRRYGIYGILALILIARYIFCFLTGEYGIPDQWKGISGRNVTVEGCVTGKEDKENSRVFYLSEHLIIYDTDFSDIPIGCKVKVRGKMENFKAQRNPGGFDEQKYYIRKKYWTKMYADEFVILNENRDTVREYLFQLREKWTLAMKEKLGEESGGILAAMVLGNKGSADITEKEWYQKAGLGHLMAVSGCHVSIIASLIYFLLKKMRIPVLAASTLTGTALFFYVMLCQSPVSAVRAYIMYMVLLGAKVSGRVYQGRRSLVLAAFAVLMWRPMDILDAGFLLSFGAMAGVWIVYPVLEGIIPIPGIVLSISVELVLLPILLYFYYEIPVYSLIFGSVAAGFFSLVMLSGVVGCVFAPAWFPAEWILNIYHEISRLELGLPGARWIAGKPEIWKIVLYYILLVMILYFYNKVKKRPFCIAFLCLMFLFVRIPERGIVTFTMLDVGQGDGFFLEGPEGMTYLFDGGSSDQNQPGKYILEPYLKYRGTGTVDYVFLSHGDQDHVNGVVEILERQDVGVRIRNLVLPERRVWDETLISIAELADSLGVRVYTIKSGSYLTEGDLEIRALYPGEQVDMEVGNDTSLVLDIRFRDFSVLMTGDLGKEGEEELLEQKELGKYLILKAGHHGSKYSSSEEFIRRVQPEYAFISAGENNRYGHPHSEVLKRLKKYNIQIFRTDQDGSIEIKSDGFAISRDLC